MKTANRFSIESCTTATMIEQQAGALERCRAWVAQMGRPLLSWEVVGHWNVAAETCAACGGAFEEPPFGCGTAVWIEMRPDGDRLYHSEASGKRECRPAGVPIWWHVPLLGEDAESEAVQSDIFGFIKEQLEEEE